MLAIGKSSLLKLVGAGALAALCGACSSMEHVIPANMFGPANNPGTTSLNVPTTEADKIKTLPMSAADLDCPPVDIQDGGATQRIGGPANSAVRYQFDITNTARECEPQGANFSLKVGVSGLLLIGPAGSPGTYGTTVRVRVARGDKTVFEKAYRAEANASGDARAPFQIVTEPVLLPLTRTQLADDYTISVSLGEGRMAETPHKRRHKPAAAAEAH